MQHEKMHGFEPFFNPPERPPPPFVAKGQEPAANAAQFDESLLLDPPTPRGDILKVDLNMPIAPD